MNKQEANQKAIARIKGQPIEPGTIVGCEQHPLSWELVRYEGDQAVCRIEDKEQRFPASEIFDLKKLINVANHYLNVGFWEEGMESMIVEIGQ